MKRIKKTERGKGNKPPGAGVKWIKMHMQKIDCL